MRALIDTSSLVSFVRYYLPFDKENRLKKLFEEKFNSGEIILLDKVYDESKYVAKGIVVEQLTFFTDKKKHIKTDSILPDQKFFNVLENQLCYGAQKRKLSSTEFEVKKNEYLDSADAKLILFCENEKKTPEIEKPFLVTEESGTSNDIKLFKKLPEICSVLGIDYCNLPTLLKDHFKLNLSEYLT